MALHFPPLQLRDENRELRRQLNEARELAETESERYVGHWCLMTGPSFTGG